MSMINLQEPLAFPDRLKKFRGVIVVHGIVPGRLRLKIDKIFQDDEACQLVQNFLQAQAGILKVKVNKYSSSVLLFYLKTWKLAECIAQLEDFLEDLTCRKKEPKKPVGKISCDWHTLVSEKVAKKLESNSDDGLQENQVSNRQLDYGLNVLQAKEKNFPSTNHGATIL